MRHISLPLRSWVVVALGVVSIFSLAGCGSSDPYPPASSAVSTTCNDLDSYFSSHAAPSSQLNKVLKEAKRSGDPVLERAARAYQAAVAPFNQSEKNTAFAKMIGRCQYYGIGPNQSP